MNQRAALMGDVAMRRRFDALAASHGAASLGLVALLAITGSLILAKPMDIDLAIGCALLAIAAVYALAMTAIGKLARTGGLLHGRFDFRAGSHGAAGFCIVGVFACSGLLTLSDSWRTPNALGLSLLAVSVGCAIGMVSWGVTCRTSEDE